MDDTKIGYCRHPSPNRTVHSKEIPNAIRGQLALDRSDHAVDLSLRRTAVVMRTDAILAEQWETWRRSLGGPEQRQPSSKDRTQTERRSGWAEVTLPVLTFDGTRRASCRPNQAKDSYEEFDQPLQRTATEANHLRVSSSMTPKVHAVAELTYLFAVIH